ncbi:MAG: hypothetical protein AMXMBFR64_27240 [Myxococcales bacterium]
MTAVQHSGQSLYDDLPVVRRLRRQIRAWWSIEVAFTDASGYVLDHARGFVVPPRNDLCRAELTSEEGFRRCNRSVATAVQATLAQTPCLPRIIECHLKLPVIVVPLVHEERPVGALFAGGFLVDDERERRRPEVAEAAWQWGLPVDVDPTASFPVIARRDLAYLRDLMSAMADEVAPRMAEAASQGPEETPSEVLFKANIVGGSRVLRELGDRIALVAGSESTVLVTGENGTGKELVARAIHVMSRRRDRAFVVQNCSALNDNLLESELFGHVRGSFTGAARDKKGLFEVAHGGTFFLDEVGDMTLTMQVKMLRVIQHGTFTPVGDTETRTVDVRVVAATHRPLLAMVEEGRFREDLYYRLNVINLHLPPLRDRREDLPALCDTFLERVARKARWPVKRLGPGVMERFWSYPWPGNIRELENEIERLHVLSGASDVISADLVSERIGAKTHPNLERVIAARGSLAESVTAMERLVIAEGLVRTHWNKRRLAAELGISRTTLLKKIKGFGLEGPDPSFRM